MPLVTAFNLSKEDRLSEIEAAVRGALVSMPELKINDYEVDLVPVFRPDGFHGTVTRINVDLWERTERTKEALQELATRVARAFQNVAGTDRKVKVVIRPYDVGHSGWVSRLLRLRLDWRNAGRAHPHLHASDLLISGAHMFQDGLPLRGRNLPGVDRCSAVQGCTSHRQI